MTGRTHVLGGTAFALGGFLCLKAGDMLIPDVSDMLQLGIIMPYALWASTMPDLDQDKDTTAQSSPINLIIQKFFILIKAGHRSAKSHVVPVILSALIYVALTFNFIGTNLNGAEISIASLITLGFLLGVFSHFILDCMTRKGLKIGSVVIRFVPDLDMFGAGTHYEMIVRKILYVIDCILIILLFI